jgi:hypothetical protein
VNTRSFFQEASLGDPVPRAAAAAREVIAATEAQERLMEDYRTGRATAAQVTKGDMRLGKAHQRLYDCESGRIPQFRE